MATIDSGIIRDYLGNIAKARNDIVISTTLTAQEKSTHLALLDKENDELLQTYEIYNLLKDDLSYLTFQNLVAEFNNFKQSAQLQINNITTTTGLVNGCFFSKGVFKVYKNYTPEFLGTKRLCLKLTCGNLMSSFNVKFYDLGGFSPLSSGMISNYFYHDGSAFNGFKTTINSPLKKYVKKNSVNSDFLIDFSLHSSCNYIAILLSDFFTHTQPTFDFNNFSFVLFNTEQEILDAGYVLK